MVRFSYVQTPDYPLSDSIDMIRTADDLGFYACYSVDEIYHKDMWLLFAAAADKTRNIRMGPNVTHVILRDPTLIAQQLATLDELTGGRAEAVVSFGNLVMLSQYHVQWQGSRPLARVREGMSVLRTMLDTGKIDHQGEFFNYMGLFTAARPPVSSSRVASCWAIRVGSRRITWVTSGPMRMLRVLSAAAANSSHMSLW